MQPSLRERGANNTHRTVLNSAEFETMHRPALLRDVRLRDQRSATSARLSERDKRE